MSQTTRRMELTLLLPLSSHRSCLWIRPWGQLGPKVDSASRTSLGRSARTPSPMTTQLGADIQKSRWRRRSYREYIYDILIKPRVLGNLYSEYNEVKRRKATMLEKEQQSPEPPRKMILRKYSNQ